MKAFRLFSSPQCTLCVPVKDLLNSFIMEHPKKFSLEVVDITKRENREWFSKFKHDIPVVYLDGKEIARHRLEPKELNKCLEAM
jgi:glutaredoxin